MSPVSSILPILGVTFIDIVGFSMLIPMLPYFVTHFGASAYVVGLLVATFSFCQFVSAPLWGIVSDRIGRKTRPHHQSDRRNDRLGDARSRAEHRRRAFAGADRGCLCRARPRRRLGRKYQHHASLRRRSRRAASERSRAFGLIGAMFAAGMVFGPAGGGLLYREYGFAVPFLVAAALQFLDVDRHDRDASGIALAARRRTGRTSESCDRGDLRQSPILAAFSCQKLALSLAFTDGIRCSRSILPGSCIRARRDDVLFLGFRGLQRLHQRRQVGQGVASPRRSRDVTLGLGLLVAGMACTPFVHNPLSFAGVMVLFAMGSAYTNNGITAMITNAASEREQGMVLGVGSSSIRSRGSRAAGFHRSPDHLRFRLRRHRIAGHGHHWPHPRRAKQSADAHGSTRHSRDPCCRRIGDDVKSKITGTTLPVLEVGLNRATRSSRSPASFHG